MTDSPDRFKTSPGELALRDTQPHQEGTTWNIVSFSPTAHKHTDSESRRCGRGRHSSVVSPRAPDTHEHERGGRHDAE